MAEPTKADLQKELEEKEAELAAARSDLENLQNQLRETQAVAGEADPDAPKVVLDVAGVDALRQAVAEFREVQAAPNSVDRSGLLAVAGGTLADRVEGILNS